MHIYVYEIITILGYDVTLRARTPKHVFKINYIQQH